MEIFGTPQYIWNG